MRRPPRVHVGYRLPKEVVAAIKAEAAKTAKSETEIVERWLREAAQRAGHKGAPSAA